MKLLIEIIILSVLYKFSVFLTSLLQLPVPPVLIGMGLLLVLLLTGVLKPAQLDQSSRFFSRHMILFFVPVMVGIVQYWEVIKQGGWYLLLTVIISTTFVLITTAFITTLFKKERESE